MGKKAHRAGRAQKRQTDRAQSLHRKKGVLLCLPSLQGHSRTEQVLQAVMSGVLSARPDFPYLVEPFVMLNAYPVADARNACTQHFMKNTDHEYLAFWDADQAPPPNWLDLIGHGDIVSGLTFMWDANRKPHQRLQLNQLRINDMNQTESILWEPTTKPYEVDIVGTACMVIHRRVLEKLGPRPFAEPVGPDGVRMMGEDVYFCRKARSEGFKITIVPTVIFDHFKTIGLVGMYEAIQTAIRIAKKVGYQKGYADGKAGNVNLVPDAPAPVLGSGCIPPDELKAAHQEWCAINGDPRYPISLELCSFIGRLAEQRTPRSACDIGSGISSWVLRRLGLERVATFEASEEWAGKTRAFLDGRGFKDSAVQAWPVEAGGQFDLVVYDSSPDGAGGRREEHLEMVASLVAPHGSLVIDDFHWQGYRRNVERFFSGREWNLTSLENETTDQWGRYGAIVERAA